MSPIFQFINSHGIETLVAAYLLSAVLSGMPPLPKDASYWAQWAYHTSQILRGNLAQYLKQGPPPAGGSE